MASGGKQDWTTSRPTLRRLLWYRERLGAGGFATAEAMAAHECSDRTVYRDMSYAGTLKWDVGFCRARRMWVLESGSASLPLLTLRERELVALLVAEEALRSYAGSPYAAALRSAFDKILPLLDAPVSIDLRQAPLPRFASPPPRPVE